MHPAAGRAEGQNRDHEVAEGGAPQVEDQRHSAHKQGKVQGVVMRAGTVIINQ